MKEMDKAMFPYTQGGMMGYSTKKPHIISNELTKLVRQQWEYEDKPVPYKMEHVKRRTEDELVVQEPRTKWKDNFYRRQQNMQMGFFNPFHRPYECLGGEFTLDPKQLVLNVYTKCLPKQLKEKPAFVRKKRIIEDETKEEERQAPEKTEKPVVVEEHEGDHMTLWEHIRESNGQIRYVSSGQPYQHANTALQNMRKKQSKSDVLTPCNLMVVKSVSSLVDINIGKTCAIVIASPDKMDSTVPEPPAATEPEISELPDEPVKEETTESDMQLRSNTSRLMQIYERERKERIKRDFLLKLESIYTILLSIHNMKTNLLRNKNPLSKELVAALKKEQSPAERISRLASALQSTHQRMSTSTDTLSSQDNPNVYQSIGNSTCTTGTTPQSNSSPSKLPLRRMTTFGNSPRGIGVFGAANSWAMRVRKMVTPASDVIETWEDLMQTSDRNQKLFSKLQITGMFLGALNKRKRSTELEERKMPMWQMVANEKSHISPQKRRSSDPEARLRQLREDYKALKASLARENQAELSKLDREKLALFEFKFNVLENTPPLFVQHFKDMKRALKNFSFDSDNVEVQPSEWFQKLREETVNLGLDSDEDVQALMAKMGRFNQMDSKTVSQAKAKLCMLMMSMPAYEICKVTVQQAYKFVSEEILLGSAGTMERWLKSRRLPMVLENVK